MAKMTHEERIKAAIAFQEVDRIPAGIWGHRPFAELDPIYLAETQLGFAMKNDFDFIKLNPQAFVHYQDYGISINMFTSPCDMRKTSERRTMIQTLDDWKAIEVLPGYYGSLGRTVLLTKWMQKLQKQAGVKIPYIVTFNSPLTNMMELGGRGNLAKTKELMMEYPEVFHEVLEKLTETGKNYIKANMDYEPAGYFFATRFACTDYFTEEEYDEWGMKYDLQLFDLIKDDFYFNQLHIHGQNAMWDKIANYPGTVINWHDAWIPPTLEEGRKRCHKCIQGGLNERELGTWTPEEVKWHVKDAVQRAGREGLIIGNGCGAWPWPSDENLYAIKEALDELEV